MYMPLNYKMQEQWRLKYISVSRHTSDHGLLQSEVCVFINQKYEKYTQFLGSNILTKE
jgi:hypothetical protein